MSKLLHQIRQEEHWKGLTVSEGITIGRVVKILGGAKQVFREALEDSEIERETRRLRAAIRLARRQLLAIRRRAEIQLGADHAYIFDSHLLMLEDKKLISDVEQYIRQEKTNAEWAVKVATDQILAIYAEIKDDYLRERGSDIEDVTGRILAALSGERTQVTRLTEDSVVVAEELMPSAVAELDFERAKAIVTDSGGWTSHSSIIARGLGIPAIVGLRDFHRRARTGDQVIVDALKGEVILHPFAKTLRSYRSETGQIGVARTRAGSTGLVPVECRTADGVRVGLMANVELPAEYSGVKRFGAEGIGLYRSEFLLSHQGFLPSEDVQIAAYSHLGKISGNFPATIRLFDLGGDKIGIQGNGDSERNPALGLRAIRFSLQQESLLRTQVRAILRAAADVDLRLVLPMVTDTDDVRRAKKIIDEECESLKKAQIPFRKAPIGAMIEVPSAVFTARSIAADVEFLSLGTNDLVQYLLAVDRGNEEVAEWFRSLHPSVLQSVAMVVRAAHVHSIPVVACGEMAGTPVYAAMLIGLGITELSMTASLIPRMRNALSSLETPRLSEIAESCLDCATADDVEEIVRREFGRQWPSVFTDRNLPRAKH